LQPTGAQLEGNGIRSHVPCFIRAMSSYDIASRQWGWVMAWLTQVGSMVWGRGCLVTVWICLGLKIWFMERVVIVCVRGGGLAGGIRLETMECGRGEAGLRCSSVGWRGGCGYKFKEDSRVLKLPGKDATMVGESSRKSDKASVVETISGGTAICEEPKCSRVTWWLAWLTSLGKICEEVQWYWFSSNNTWREIKNFCKWGSKHL